MKNIIYLLVVVFMMISCEEKMVVIPEFEPIDTGKVVYVEELTGVRCPNCPAGSARLESIQNLYPDNVVIVGIHGIDLAKPLDESKYDFRNEDAADLEIFLKDWLGKPSAYFNRERFEELETAGLWGHPGVGEWQSYVERELEKPQIMEVTIIKSFDPITRVLDVTVAALPLEDLSGEFKVSIMLTESEIIDAQDDQNQVLDEYEHNHVLRDVITKFDGDTFANQLTKGQAQTKNYTYTIPNDGTGLWVPEHIEIVAFIANAEGESEEVLQAAKAHLVD